jgi:TRAP-type C4-dicarboxylate transport system substrate-binding protein
MNDNALKSYPPEIRKVVLDGFYHMTTVANNDPKYTQLAAYEAFREAGGTVYVPTPEEKAQFVEGVQPLKKWFTDKYGPEWLDALETAIADAEAEIAEEDARLMQ